MTLNYTCCYLKMKSAMKNVFNYSNLNLWLSLSNAVEDDYWKVIAANSVFNEYLKTI